MAKQKQGATNPGLANRKEMEQAMNDVHRQHRQGFGHDGNYSIPEAISLLGK